MTTPVTTETVRRAADRLLGRIAHWTPSRFATTASGGPGIPGVLAGGTPPSRGDVVYTLVQALADLDADVEGEPRRTMPRLERDAGLPDQLAVVVDDLLAAGPPPDVLAEADRVLRGAAAAVGR